MVGTMMLPPEMMDWIFTFLQRDHDALRSCSAAHPLLSSLAQRHFFVHIIFYVGFDSNHRIPLATNGFPVSRLSRCLAERPHLATHIRSITIDGAAFSRPPLRNFEELSALLPLIPRSETISLRHVGWFEFPEVLRSALLGCLRTPRMREMCLDNSLDFPFAVLDEFRNIKNLKLGASGCSFMYHPVQRSLTSLSLVDNNLAKYIAWAGSRLNGLTSLHAKAKFQAFPNISPILTSCMESLTSLTLDIGSFLRTAYRGGIPTGPWRGFPFNLSTLAYLEVVTFHAMLGAAKYPSFQETLKEVRFVEGCNSSLPAMADLIASAGPSLNHIILNLDFEVGGAHYLHDGMEWKPLILLCDSLRHVRVDLCIRALNSRVRLSFSEVVDSLVKDEGLSRLVERGSLVLKPFPVDF